MTLVHSLEPNLLYTRDYCGKRLRWHIVQDPCAPGKAPDVVFDEPDFCPLVDASEQERAQLASVLDTFDAVHSKGPSRLASLLSLLLTCYAEHHKRKIAECGDDRVLFELAMVGELGCTEMLLTGSGDSAVQQACFSIPVNVDLSAAQQLIKYCHIPSTSDSTKSTPLHHPQDQQQQHQQPSAATALQDNQQQQHRFAVYVAFKIGPGVSSHTAPDIQLQHPDWFRDYLPPLTLPTWDPHTSLLEYVPHLSERLDKHLQDTCPAATLRFNLVDSLAGVFGQPIEVNMHSNKGSATTSSSSGGSGTAAAAAWKGRYTSVAMFQLLHEQLPLLLFVELGPAFPADAPVLVLQNLRRPVSDSFTTLSNVPWSPRWPVDEMTARLFNFIKQQAANIVAKDSGPVSSASSPVPGAVY